MAFRVEDKLLNLVKVFSLVDEDHLSLKEGAKLLNYSYWHLTRLYKKYKTEGLNNLLKREREVKQRKLKSKDVKLLKEYYLKSGKPQISLLRYFLSLDYPSFPEVSKEWIRRILLREGVYSPGNRGKVFRRRFSAPFPGLLVQGDSSLKRWIPEDETYYHLIVFLDDCTRLCLAARIVKRDTIEEHFALLKGIVKKYGRFVALYYDNDEKYSYIRHGNSRFFEYKKEKADLQVVRALSELGISVINSRPYDPHGKGKIERCIETVILQLPVWFGREKVKTLEEANQVLKEYIKYYNTVQVHREIKMTPYEKFLELKEGSRFSRVEDEVDLDKIFSYREERKVDRDNTIRFGGEVYQLERKPFVYSYTGKKAEIRYLPNRAISIYIDGELMKYKKLLTVSKEAVKSGVKVHGKVAIL